MTFGCIVDIGATKTSICCLEDSLIVSDTRCFVLLIGPISLLTMLLNSIVLNTGGDDVTEMLYVLLQQTCFPYKELDLVKLYHWQLFEDLKQTQCTMAPVRYYL
jgi:actin-related protein 8